MASPAPDLEELHAAHTFGSGRDARRLQSSWLAWYDAGHRQMPWRREEADTACIDDDERAQWAYRVWVSEVMLQQTQVDRVVPYFERWMARFPTLGALAEASIDEVRQVWSGLGYYRRAAFLLEGAQQIVRERGGVPPCSVEGWAKVKGVGPYTAAAISSIVYGEQQAVVDGNVIRVLARLRAVDANPKATSTTKLWWRLGAELMAGCERPGAFNQAMMELGATLCAKAAPACGECPLRADCRARAQADAGDGPVTRFPSVAPKSAPRETRLAVCVLQRVTPEAARAAAALPSAGARRAALWRAGQLLLLKRPETRGAGAKNPKLLAGLWELPTAELGGGAGEGATPDGALSSEPASAADEPSAALDGVLRPLGVELRDSRVLQRRLLTVDGAGAERCLVHTFSHLKHIMHVEWVALEAEPAPRARAAKGAAAVESCWLPLAELDSKGTSSAVGKAVECARAYAEGAPARGKRGGGGGAAAGGTKRPKGAAADAAANGSMRIDQFMHRSTVS